MVVYHFDSLDVSGKPYLKTLSCFYTRPSILDISNNHAMKFLDIVEMSGLSKVCVWKMPFPPGGVQVDTEGSPNVYFITDWSQ